MSRIVELRDTKPLRVLRSELKDEVIEICRCGLSANWPWCDSSHKATRGENPETLYRYVRSVPEGQLLRIELPQMPPEQRPSQAKSPPDAGPGNMI